MARTINLDSSRSPAGSADKQLIAVGFLCLLGYLFLAIYSRGTFGEPNLVGFYTCIGFVGLPPLALFGFTTRLRREFSVANILIWATLFRLCGLIGVPLFEDDYFRYLWDGYRFSIDGTPYGSTPFEFFADPSVPQTFQLILNEINYPDLPTIYGPTTELAFLVAHWLSPGKLVGLQLILIVMDIAIIWLLRTECSSRYLFLYAFCPLVIKEIAYTAHPEAVGMLCLVGAIVCRRRNAQVPLGILLGLAIGARVFAWVLVPFLLVRTGWRVWVALATTTLLLYITFFLRGASEFEALFVFARHWEFNSFLYGITSYFTGDGIAKLILGVGFLIGVTFYLLRYSRNTVFEIPRGDLLLGCFLLISAVVNPWYVVWVLPFAMVYPSFWAWTSAYAVFLSYISALNLGLIDQDPFSQPIWSRVLQAVLLLLAIGIDLCRKKAQSPVEQSDRRQ
ncbi:MAG: glycosyltransferase family 87 protein [Gammaproteobacteria bacterium]|nr:glycosyltransferase family 87 protein [Gammaproteobacteria bacterium]